MKDCIENCIDAALKLVALKVPYGWRVQLAWWQHICAQRHRQIHAKFIQDNVADMVDHDWYEWVGSLPTNDFIHVIMLSEPEIEPVPEDMIAIDEIVNHILEQGEIDGSTEIKT